MSKFYNRQQQEKNGLILGFLLSLLIHGAIALILSRYKTKELLSVKEKSLTPITIVELAEPKNTETSSGNSSSNALATSTQNSSKIAAARTPTNPPVAEKPPTPPKTPASPPAKPATSSSKIEPATEKSNTLQATEAAKVASTPPAKPEKKVNRSIVKPKEPIEADRLPKPLENRNIAEKKPLANTDKLAPTPKLPSSKPVQEKRSLANFNRDRGDFAGTVANNSDATSKTDNSGDNTNNNNTTANSNSNQSSAPLSIACKDNCQPEYPDVLDGAEGTAGIQLILDRQGKVIDAAIAISSGNSLLNEQALEAARQMEFSETDRDRAIVQINLSFVVADDEW